MDLLGEYSSDEDAGKSTQQTLTGAAITPKETTRGHVKLIDSTEAKATDLFEREVPHTRGNWTGHVFVDMPSSFWRRANTSVASFCSCLEEAGWKGTVLSHTANLHLSLSRPFFLQQSSIESFVHSLQQQLSLERSTKLVVKGEKLLINDNGTRSFWCWSLASNLFIQRITDCVDGVLRDYNQKTYYESPEFHVSLASLPGNVEEILKRHAATKEARQGAAEGNDSRSGCSDEYKDEDGGDESNYGPIIISVDHINVAFGTTKSFRIDLRA